MFLNYLFWIVLVLYFAGYWGPAPWGGRISWGAVLILLIIVGLRSFKIDIG